MLFLMVGCYSLGFPLGSATFLSLCPRVLQVPFLTTLSPHLYLVVFLPNSLLPLGVLYFCLLSPSPIRMEIP